jgi:methyl-accepting chemotaxis protein
MRRSVSIGVLIRFFAFDAFFAFLVPFALQRMLEIPVTATVLAIQAGGILFRVGASMLSLVYTLGPADEWESTIKSARTDALVLRAVSTLQTAPGRFAFWYTIFWLLMLTLQMIAFAVFVPGSVTESSLGGMSFILGAVLLGAFTFNYPLTTVLVSNAHVEAVREAQARSLELPRNPIRLGWRIALLALGLAIAPTLYVAALGYQTETRAADERAIGLATGVSARLAQALRDGHGANQVIADIDDSEGNVELAIVGPRAERIADSSTSLEESTIQMALRNAVRAHPAEGHLFVADRAIVYERTERNGPIAVAIAPHTRGASSGFLITVTVFLVAVLGFAIFSSFSVSLSISRPIERISAASQHLIDEGKLHKLELLPIVNGDEIGMLTERFNALMDLLRDLSRVAHDVSEGDLTVEVQGQGDLPESFRGMVESLRMIVHGIRENASMLSAAAAEIYAVSQEQEAATAAQSTAVHEIGNTMDSLAESAAHVAEAVEGVRANAERTLSTADQMVERIGELTARAGRISEILQVIREVADRTDLLALNGSLEATRAGEFGRGFALLASEMRRLAERVAGAVADVRTLIDDIRDSGASTAMATEEGRKLADDTAAAARSIALVTQQQRTGTEQVSMSVREIVDVVAQAAAATTQSRTAAEDLKAQADRLHALVERFHVSEAA